MCTWCWRWWLFLCHCYPSILHCEAKEKRMQLQSTQVHRTSHQMCAFIDLNGWMNEHHKIKCGDCEGHTQKQLLLAHIYINLPQIFIAMSCDYFFVLQTNRKREKWNRKKCAHASQLSGSFSLFSSLSLPSLRTLRQAKRWVKQRNLIA